MFEAKSKKVEPIKKQADLPNTSSEKNVKNLVAMFERKATNKFDQDKTKFLSNNASSNQKVQNPFVKQQTFQKKEEPPKKVEFPLATKTTFV